LLICGVWRPGLGVLGPADRQGGRLGLRDGPKTSAFSGLVRWVQIDLDVDDHDHLISPEERLRVAMTRR
jgi:hypothetical protein